MRIGCRFLVDTFVSNIMHGVAEEGEPLDGDEVDEIADDIRNRLNELNGNV